MERERKHSDYKMKNEDFNENEEFAEFRIETNLNPSVIICLNQILADEYTLFTKTLNFHWNIIGRRFFTLHKFLEDQYHELLEVIDDVAERIRILGSHPLSTLEDFEETMNLKEIHGKDLTADDMLLALYNDHSRLKTYIINFLKNNEISDRDPGTEDFLIGLLQKHEKIAWMIGAHLEHESIKDVN